VASTTGLAYNHAVPKVGAAQFAVEIARLAHDHKAEEVTVLDLRRLSQLTDYVVICTGTSDRQIRAVADRVREYSRKIGERPYGYCGYESANWVVLDYVDVVLHVFSGPYRTYYDLELLWGDAPHLEWARSESA